jgi:L-ascorbate metabolism protein UlaG (beta-lactamase superfamily)
MLSTRIAFTLAFVSIPATAGAQEGATRASGSISVTWLGHAGMEVVSPGGTRLLIDPWVVENPYTPAEYKDTTRWSRPEFRPQAVLVTHPHGDHDGDALLLSRVSGAKVVATGDHLAAMKIPEEQYLSINIGGVQKVGDVEVHAVPAMHSAEPGRPLGYVLRFADGRTMYHTGDTWVFGDMSLIQEMFRPEIILLATGGGRSGQSPEAAAVGIRKYFKPKVVIPIHYGTEIGPFATEEQVRAAFKGDRRLTVMVPGKTMKF